MTELVSREKNGRLRNEPVFVNDPKTGKTVYLPPDHDELLRVSALIEKETATPETSLKPWHYQMLEYIDKNGFITDRQYSMITDRAKATRNNDFNKLIGLNFIQRIGKGKAVYYRKI